MPMCILCQKSLGNDSVKPSLLTQHLESSSGIKGQRMISLLVIIHDRTDFILQLKQPIIKFLEGLQWVA